MIGQQDHDKTTLLSAARHLRELIVGSGRLKSPVNELAESIDSFMAALHELNPWNNPAIESVDVEFPDRQPNETELLIRMRFPTLNHYQFLASTRLAEDAMDQATEILVADAINDLHDIAVELEEVCFIQDVHGDDEALLALSFRYRTHLYMHIPPLRFHLEELLSGR